MIHKTADGKTLEQEHRDTQRLVAYLLAYMIFLLAATTTVLAAIYYL